MCRIETDIQKKLYRRRKSSCPEDDQQVFRRIKIFYIFASYHWTCLVCVFPGSGAMIPEQTDYANNMAELIVSVLTVISIIFAFVEFLKKKK